MYARYFCLGLRAVPKTMLTNMTKPLFAALAVTVLMASCTSAPQTSYREIVSDATTVASTTYGQVQGYRDGDIYVFKGIPYAKAERFMPPVAPDRHEGVLMCRAYGPKTPQTSTNLNWKRAVTDYDFGFQFNLEPVDEFNCLVLNVWTRNINDNAKKPVFVWIHGGGFASGSGYDMDCYEGCALAEEGDIVVVNLNHRLNILGYADLRDLGGKYANSVNLGMLDLVKALEWVRDNISNFGGDPSNVTIAGQSGGGGKVSTLMCMPSAMGLFHKAITQSGSWVLHNSDEEGRALGSAVLEELGVTAANADKLNEFTYEELAAAGNSATRKLHSANGFCPTVDGTIVGAQHFAPDAPMISKDIPMIIGSNKNEFTYDNSIALKEEEVRDRLSKQIGVAKADAFISAYNEIYPGSRPEEAIYTDTFLREAAVKMADAKSAIGSKVYMYYMTWHPRNNALGACHGMELPLVFRNVSLERALTGGTESAYKMSERMSSAWLAFIKTGDPNVKGLPQWDPYTAENGNTMIFDDECKIVHNHDRALFGYDIPRHF